MFTVDELQIIRALLVREQHNTYPPIYRKEMVSHALSTIDELLKVPQ